MIAYRAGSVMNSLSNTQFITKANNLLICFFYTKVGSGKKKAGSSSMLVVVSGSFQDPAMLLAHTRGEFDFYE